MYFKQLNEKKLAQYAYLIGCQSTGEAIVVDPMRDIDQYIELAEQENLKLTAAVDTHIHADYVSGLRELAEQGIKVYASDEGGENWKYEWLINSDYEYELLKHGDTFSIGNITFNVLHTPGHTPESISILVTDGARTDQPMGILTGDFVFVGDVGRPDLLETAAGQKGAMKPAARELFYSVEEFKELPDYLQVWPAHGSGSACGKALGAVPESTVGYEKRFSPAFASSGCEAEFVDFILDGQPEPPYYFGRMKKVNREGPALVGKLPEPEKITVDELLEKDGEIIDARDRHSYMSGHLEGSLLATYDANFNTIAGSYADPEKDIFLIINQHDLSQAVRELLRVGLDKIKGYVEPSELEAWDGQLSTTKVINFEEVDRQRQDGSHQVVDVRKATEYSQGHVPDSIHIAHTRLPEKMKSLPKDKELLVHCASGKRASYASSLLEKDGFRVQWVDDSFKNWNRP